MLLASKSEFDAEEKNENEITLRVGQRTFVCLKNELSERSEYFRAMFSHEFLEKDKKEIVLNDVDEKAFKLVLDAESPDSLTDVDDILAILRVSSMLQFDQETEKYETFIITNYICTYPLRVMTASFEMDRHNLYKRSSAYCLWNFSDLMTTDDFLNLPYSHLLHYLENNGLHLEKGEIEVFKSIENWTDHNEPDAEVVIRLMETVRVNFLSMNELDEIMNSPLVSNISELCDFFSNLKEGKQEKSLKCSKCLMTNSSVEEGSKSCCHNINPNDLNPRTFCAIPCTVIPCNLLYPQNNKIFPTVYGYNGEELQKILTLDHEPFSEAFIGFKIISVGFKLYLFGGEHGYGTGLFNMAVWSYNFISESWHYECEISQQRRHFAVTVLNDCIFLLGGTGRYRKVLKTVEKFNMKTKEWSICTKLTNANSFAPAVCTYENKIYIVDGNGRSFSAYDPSDNIFNSLPIDLQKVAGLRFIAIYQDYLYAVEGSCARIYRWQIFNNANSLYPAENVGKFRHEGDSVLVNNCIYHFSYIDEESLCYVEKLSIDNLEIQLVSSYPYKSSRDFQFIFNGTFILPNYF